MIRFRDIAVVCSGLSEPGCGISRIRGLVIAAGLLATTWSALSNHPHQLAYFNEVAGGPENGHKHLLHSNLDWGQDLLYVKDWLDARACTGVDYYVLSGTFYDPHDLGISASPLPDAIAEPNKAHDPHQPLRLPSGDYLASVNFLKRNPALIPRGADRWHSSLIEAAEFLEGLPPVERISLSTTVHRVYPGSSQRNDSSPCDLPSVSTRANSSHCSPRKMELRSDCRFEFAADRIRVLLERIKPVDQPMSASFCLHILAARGTEATFSHNTLHSGNDILRLFTDSEFSRSYFGTPALIRTRYGIRPASDQWYGKLASESHYDQTVVVLARLEQPLILPFNIDGELLSLKDVLADSVASFVPSQSELEWAALAYLAYLPADATWQNKFGETYSFNDIATELLMRDLSTASSCCGCHILEALTWLHYVDATETRFLSRENRHAVSRRLHRYRDVMRATQNADGSWGPKWYDIVESDHYRNDVDRLSRDSDLALRLLATSHLVAWARALPDDLSVDRRALDAASRWMLLTLEAVDDQFISSHFCPCSHAVTALTN